MFCDFTRKKGTVDAVMLLAEFAGRQIDGHEIDAARVRRYIRYAVGFSQTSQAVTLSRLEISIYNYAKVPSETLAKAENEARRIFQQAGVETVWVTCCPKPETIEPDSCSLVDATHLLLKIIPHALTQQLFHRDDVLGTALLNEKGTGYYAYAFLDHIQVHEQRFGFALLGTCWPTKLGTCCWAQIPIPSAE